MKSAYHFDAAGVVIRTSDGLSIWPTMIEWIDYQLWLSQGGVPDPYVEPLENVLARISLQRDQMLAAGVTYNGVLYRSDETSSRRLTTVLALMANGVPLPDPLPWRDANNVTRHLSRADVLGLAGAMAGAALQAFVWAWQQEDAAIAAATPS